MGSAGENAPDRLRLSAIVPATDRPATLERCVDAIRRAADPPEEIIVVDSPPRSGPAAARNAGATRATGASAGIRGLRRARARGRVRAHPGGVRRRADTGAPCSAPTTTHPQADGVVSIFRNLLHHCDPSQFRRAGYHLLGRARRRAHGRVRGGRGLRLRALSRTVRRGHRARAATGRNGVDIQLDPEIQGTHLKRWGLGSMVKTDLFYRGAPWVALMLARGRSPIRLNVSGRHLAGTIACLGALALAASGRFLPAALLAAGFVGINTRLYALLLRRGGLRAVVAGFGLHVLHSLIALVAAPAGLLAFVFSRRLKARPPRPLPQAADR